MRASLTARLPVCPSVRLSICPSARGGFALLDVLLALALLGSAGLAVVSLLDQALRAEQVARAVEREYQAADRVLTALTLLHRAELDQRIGRRPLGEFIVDIQRPERGLYRIAVAGVSAPGRDLLVTVVARPEGTP